MFSSDFLICIGGLRSGTALTQSRADFAWDPRDLGSCNFDVAWDLGILDLAALILRGILQILDFDLWSRHKSVSEAM